MLLLAGAEILCGNIYDAVCVDIKGDLDLRNAAACRCDAVKVEAAEALVVLSHLTLALENVDLNGSLIIGCGGEDLALLGRDGGVTLDELGAHAAEGLDTEGQRGYIQKQNALYIACKNAALNCSADSDTFIGVDALEAFLAGEGLDHFLNSGDTGRAADHEDLGNVAGGQTGVGQSLLYGAHGLLDEVMGQLIELCAGKSYIKVLRTGCIGGDVRQVDVRGGNAGQLDFCLLGSLTQTLHCDLIAGQVDALCLLELVDEVLGDACIKVVAAEAVVTCGCKNFDNTVADLENGDIEGAAAEVVDHDLLIGLLIKAVCQSCCGRLVDDTLYIKTCDLACVLGCLTLSVGEVCRNGDDSFRYGLAEVALCVCLQLLKDHCGDLLRCVVFIVNSDLVRGTHLTLDRRDGAVGVGDGLALCDLTYHTLAGLCECDD